MLSKFRGMGRGNSVPSKRAHADGLPVEQLEERRLLAATTTGISVITKAGAMAVTPKSPQQFWLWSLG